MFFNPKELIVAVAKRVAISYALTNGIPPEQVGIAGELVEGLLKGLDYQTTPTPIYQQLSKIISCSIENVIRKNPEYEIPDDCIETLTEMFSFENSVQYLNAADPIFEVCESIKTACSKSRDCDVTSLPIEDISNRLLQDIYDSICNNHELSTLFSTIRIEELNRKVDFILSSLMKKETENHNLIDLRKDIAQRSDTSSDSMSEYIETQVGKEICEWMSTDACDNDIIEEALYDLPLCRESAMALYQLTMDYDGLLELYVVIFDQYTEFLTDSELSQLLDRMKKVFDPEIWKSYEAQLMN